VADGLESRHPRIEHWRRVMRAGYRTIPAILTYITLAVGGSIAAVFPWGRRHLLWVIVIVLAAVIVVIVGGSYRESRTLEKNHKDEQSALRDAHRAELARLQAEHQTELNAALTAAVAARAGGSVSPDPADWNAYCDYYPPAILTFNLRHRLNNAGAVQAFSEFRCAVTDPGGVQTEAPDRSINLSPRGWWLSAHYNPAAFPGAPPVRSGTYHFIWTGQDAKGIWHEITRGTYEVVGSAAGSGHCT
jgi:cell division protein FtsL